MRIIVLYNSNIVEDITNKISNYIRFIKYNSSNLGHPENTLRQRMTKSNLYLNESHAKKIKSCRGDTQLGRLFVARHTEGNIEIMV